MGGVGQGDGEPGTPIGSGEEEGSSAAGSAPGQHCLEVDVLLEELAEMLGQELELPRIRPKGAGNVMSERLKYSGIHRVGPDSLRHVKRTLKEALKRQIMEGEYNPEDPRMCPPSVTTDIEAAKK